MLCYNISVHTFRREGFHMRKLGIFILVAVLSIIGLAEVDLETLSNRVDLLEEYVNMLYESLGERVTNEELEVAVSNLSEELENLKALIDELSQKNEELVVTLNIHDNDILKIYETLGEIVEKVEMLMAKFEPAESEETETEEVTVDINDLAEIVNGLAMQIGDLDYLIGKRLSALEGKVDALAEKTAVEELDGRVAELETQVLNINSTLSDGLPMIRTAVYQLAEDLAALEAKMTEYIAVSLETLKEELQVIPDEIVGYEELALVVENLEAAIEQRVGAVEEHVDTMFEEISSLKETLETLSLKANMFDDDIVKLYEALGNKVEKDEFESQLADMKAENEQLKKDFEAKLAEKDAKISELNTFALVGIALGAIGVALGIWAVVK